MDILISPIADLTAYPVLIIVLIIIFMCLVGLKSYFIKNPQNKFIRNYLKLNDEEILVTEELKQRINFGFIQFFFIFILCFFLGYGIGGGYSISKKIDIGKLNYTKNGSTITFNSGESKEIYLIDTNSLYYFYVLKGEKTINISPIGAIQNIELKNK